jgi:CheY-like chemotaxis protein
MEATYETINTSRCCLPSIEDSSASGSSFFGEAAFREKIRPAKILIVDDDQAMLALVSDVLLLSGHRVMVAENGGEGFDLFSREEFDLVVTDLTMPGMDGWELARQVKTISPSTPVLAMTGWNGQEMTGRMKEEAVDSVMFKPFTLVDFLVSVQRMIEANR